MNTSKKGTGTFIQQRVTAAINVVFVAFLIWLVVSMAGADRAQMTDLFSNWLVAILAIVFVVNAMVHMRIGMGEVIEDYVHDPKLFSLTMTLNTVFAMIVGAIGVVSILVLAFAG